MKKTTYLFLLFVICSHFSFSQISIQKENLVGEWFTHVSMLSNDMFLCRDMERLRTASMAISLTFQDDGRVIRKNFYPPQERGWCGTQPVPIPVSETLTQLGLTEEGTWEVVDDDTILLQFGTNEIKWRVANARKDVNTGMIDYNEEAAIIQVVKAE